MLSCAINDRKYGVLLTFWRPFSVLLIWRWRSSNIEYYSTDSNSAHPNYVKTSELKNIHWNNDQCSIFQISALTKHTHFHKRLQYSSIKKNICDIYNYKWHSFLSIHIFGSQNISQISICQTIMFYLDAFIDHANYFFCCLCGEMTIYSTATCNIAL